MIPSANLRYTFLLACLVIGPIVILIGLFNRWLWFRPAPDVGQVVVVATESYSHPSLRDIFMIRDNSVVTIGPVNAGIEGQTVMMYFHPDNTSFGMETPDLRWEGNELHVYGDWQAIKRNEPPEWILSVSENCRVIDKGRSRRHTPADAALITPGAALQVSTTRIGNVRSSSTGVITAVYVDPSPGEIFRSREGAIRYIIFGAIMTVIGGFYFYGPRRGWLRWREGLTLPDDTGLWES